jgi:hypothetical protein
MKKLAAILASKSTATIFVAICSMLIAYKQTGHCYGPILPWNEEIKPGTGILIVIIYLLFSIPS